MALQPYSFTRDFVALLQSQPRAAVADDFPPYDYADAAATVAALAVTSQPQTFRLGTGASVFASALLPAVLSARQEVILVTCFWAPSKSLRDLAATLARLAASRTRPGATGAGPVPPPPPLRIRIGLSSRSLVQMLFHTASRAGHVYPPATWDAVLGLPSAAVLGAAGIDLQVKSLFFRPFSVMHPKFVVVDRQRALVPSCNVSWESWLEGCIELTGAAVQPLLAFYGGTWGDPLPALPARAEEPEGGPDPPIPGGPGLSPLDVDGPGSIVVRFGGGGGGGGPIPTVVLPSSHHRHPRIRLLPWQPAAPPPPTPLNLATLHLLATARASIYVQTPNLTARPVIDALLAALARGVDVALVTGQNMMVREQIVTSGTTTARCLRQLIKRYENAQKDKTAAAAATRRGQPCGRLVVSYFQPLAPRRPSARPPPDEEQALVGPSSSSSSPSSLSKPCRTNSSGLVVDADEPVRSHLKLTIVDRQHTLLGSGNMDRASWYTSQELGLLFHDGGLARLVKTAVERVLDGRLAEVYPTNTVAV